MQFGFLVASSTTVELVELAVFALLNPKLRRQCNFIFETPHHAPAEKQVQAFVVAILSILAEYRKFIAFAADL